MMKVKFCKLVCILVAVTMLGTSAFASEFKPYIPGANDEASDMQATWPHYDSIEEMIDAADLIVTGRAVRQIRVWIGDLPTTITSIRVTEVISGSAQVGDEIDVRQLGTTTSPELSTDYLEVGRNYLLFLVVIGDAIVPISASQGHYTIGGGGNLIPHRYNTITLTLSALRQMVAGNQPRPPAPPSIGGGTQQLPPATGERDSEDRGGTRSGTPSAIPIAQMAPQEQWLTVSAAAELTRETDASGQRFVRSGHNGRFGVRAAVWATLAGLRFEHDTTGNAGVQVRLSISRPELMTDDVMVSGWVSGNDVNWALNLFERSFTNNMRVIHFDHSGEWGQTVRVAARVDLAEMDAENLAFYNYDRVTNTFRQIREPNYRVDANGFLHFSTDRAGSIIISEGELTRGA